MRTAIFFELRFWLLVAFSLVVPSAIYIVLLKKRAISRITVLLFGFALVAMAGVDVYLLRSLERLASANPTLVDDVTFAFEISAGLYVLPILFAGIGVNMVSHVLVSHLESAERRFYIDRAEARQDAIDAQARTLPPRLPD